MKEELLDYNHMVHDVWISFKNILPSIILAIIVLAIGITLIKLLKKGITRFIDKHSKDQLITNFLTNIISFILTIFLIIICLSILGWGSITNKILAGAGLTTFIVGFALKDIGENFLAGVLMAFQRPFRLGDLIEITGIKGRVTEMRLRETMVKTPDGKDIYIPNSIILKNPLQNLTLDNHIRQEFTINLTYNEQINDAIIWIEKSIANTENVEKSPAPAVYVDELNTDGIVLKIQYWILMDSPKTSSSKLKSNIILMVINDLVNKGFVLTINKEQEMAHTLSKEQEN